MHRLIDFLMTSGSVVAARAAAATLRANDPDDLKAFDCEALALLGDGDIEAALLVCRRGLALDPGHHTLRRRMVKILKMAGRHRDAADVAGAGLRHPAGMETHLSLIELAGTPPPFFSALGEAEDYTRAMERLFVDLAAWLRSSSPDPDRQATVAAARILPKINLRMALFSGIETSALMRARAEIVGLLCDDAPLPAPTPRIPGERLRVGVLLTHVGGDPECSGILPMITPLDGTRFHKAVYVLRQGDPALTETVRAAVDEYAVLPGDYPSQVRTLRERNLDILLIGNDNTCFFTPQSLLSATRLARIQATNFVSAVSSFYPAMDVYFVGRSFLEGAWRETYGERVYPLPDIGFRFHEPPQAGAARRTRADAELEEAGIVFASGANIFKIIPELVVCWAEILHRTPGSQLMLLPFNRSVTLEQAQNFMAMVRRIMAAGGVSPGRVVFQPPQGGRAPFQATLALADVYLDSFPFSGGTTTIDAAMAGLPMVILSGDLFRGKLSDAIAHALGLGAWVVPTVPDYIRRAVALAGDPAARAAARAAITASVDPQDFHASAAFNAAVEAAYEDLARTDAGPR